MGDTAARGGDVMALGARDAMRMPPDYLAPGTMLIVRDVPKPSFPPGSRVEIITDCREGGVLVRGRLANGDLDRELCAWEEFEGLTDERHD